MGQRVERVEERLEDHEEVHQEFDRRITRNENWRLQAQGALKTIALILGAGGLAALADVVFNLF